MAQKKGNKKVVFRRIRGKIRPITVKGGSGGPKKEIKRGRKWLGSGSNKIQAAAAATSAFSTGALGLGSKAGKIGLASAIGLSVGAEVKRIHQSATMKGGFGSKVVDYFGQNLTDTGTGFLTAAVVGGASAALGRSKGVRAGLKKVSKYVKKRRSARGPRRMRQLN